MHTVAIPDHILYVDDEEALLDIGRAFLERAGGITVDVTASPHEALRMILSGRYDAIVSDYMMPEMDGIALLKQIRKAGSRVPFVIFTGRGREEVAIEALNSGADFYLQKGGNPKTQFAELANAVRQLAGGRRAETALRKSEEMLHKAESLAHLGSWEFDHGTGRLVWSDEAFRIFGLDPAEHTPTYEAFLSMVHPDDRTLFDTTYFASIADGKDTYEIEHRFFRNDTGEVRYIVERCEHLRDESGRIIRSVGMVHDITDRKLAELELLSRHEELQVAYEHLASVEEELRTSFDDLAESQHRLQGSERRLADIIEFLPDATFVVDTGGHVVAWNRAVEEMTGVPKAEMLGRGDHAYAVPFYGEARPGLVDYVLRPDGEADCPYRIVARDGEILESETSLARPGGKDTVLRLRASPLYDQKGRRVGAIETIRDITGQKRIEADLRTTKDYLENLIDHANAPIIVWNPECVITRFNRAFESLTGIPADEAVGERLEILFSEESRNASMEQIRRAMAGELWDDVEIPILDRSGSVRTVLWNSANVTQNDTDRPIATIAQGTDITARKQAQVELLQRHEELQAAYEHLASVEEELRTSFDDLAENQQDLKESNQRYRRISESISDVVYSCVLLDMGEYALDWIAGAVHEITGYTQEQLLAMRCWKTIVYPDDLPVFEREVLSLVPGASSLFELRIVRRDGSVRWLRASANCIESEGSPARLYGGWQDITEQKEAGEALRKTAEMMESIFRAAPTGIGMTVDGIITEANGRLCDIVGYTRDELVGRPVRLLYPGDAEYESVQQEMHARIEKTGACTLETRCKRKDGAIIDVLLSGTPLDSADVSRGAMFTILDISEWKALEREIAYHAEELVRQTNSLAVVNRKLNLMSSITRHDVLNQLTILLGNLWVAEEAGPGEDVSEYLDRVKSAADRIRRQIEFTRDYTDLGVRSPEWQRVADVLRPEALHGLPVDNEAGDLVVYADPMLATVFSNLMDNTLRHGESATRVRVRYHPEENGDLTLVWEDDGVGVPAEEKERIFNRGFGKNTGLGLFLIREILGITGIGITETGEPGKGARFEMLVPHGAYRIPE